jgi:hypothetical protein
MINVPNMHDISPKAKYNMGTFDEVLVKASTDFMDKAKKDGKPFFVWHNTMRRAVPQEDWLEPWCCITLVQLSSSVLPVFGRSRSESLCGRAFCCTQ